MIKLHFQKGKTTKEETYSTERAAMLAIGKLYTTGKNRLQNPKADERFWSLVGIEEKGRGNIEQRVPIFANMLAEHPAGISRKDIAIAMKKVIDLPENPDYATVVRKLEKTWR